MCARLLRSNADGGLLMCIAAWDAACAWHVPHNLAAVSTLRADLVLYCQRFMQ
mgnify:CR=1 FL=1